MTNETVRGVTLVCGATYVKRISILGSAPKDKPGQALFSPEEAVAFLACEKKLTELITTLGPALLLYGLSCSGGVGRVPAEEGTFQSSVIYLCRHPEELMGELKFSGEVKNPRRVFLGLVDIDTTTADLVAAIGQEVETDKVLSKLLMAVFTAGKGV